MQFLDGYACKDCSLNCLRCNGPEAKNCLACISETCKDDDEGCIPCDLFIKKYAKKKNEDNNLKQQFENERTFTIRFNVYVIVILLITALIIVILLMFIIVCLIFRLRIKSLSNSYQASNNICIQEPILTQRVPLPEYVSSNTKLIVNNSVQDSLIIASKFSVSEENFKKEQLDWGSRILISSGAFGNVYKCVYTDGYKCYHVAVKQPIRPTNEPFKEEQIMAQLKDHPHIVKLITTRLDENMLLVMPLLKSSLSQYLHTQKNLTLINKIRYCQQIANGMSYLMFRQIVHCDLKASNVLVVDENLVQISDFGKSEKMGDMVKSRRAVRGTITHTAMELLDPFLHILNSEATDVWSFGVTVWEIFNTTKQIPYADCVSPLNEIKIGEYLRAKNHLKTNFWPPRETSEALVVVESYMKRCLVHTQESRPTFDILWYWFSTLLPEGLKLGQDCVSSRIIF